ncbi:MAG: ATP-binding protein [Acidimicrobiales bacterium]
MARGSLRLYLGAAPGVGKTFAMLNEGTRRQQRGTDVVVAFVETHGRSNTAAQLDGLEVIPRLQVTYRGTSLEEMDTEAVIARAPTVALVDELAHTNAPGSRHEKRWQDVEQLRDAGIDVVSTLNIQHLESLNDVVERITGVKQRETIPDEVARGAEQVELVDMAPEALRRRMAHGNIYAAEKVDAALANYFRVGNLGALRELALMWVADQVDVALQDYKAAHGILDMWETRERVVVALTGAESGEQLIRRAARMTTRTHGDLLGLHVKPTDGLASRPTERLEQHRALLEGLGGEYHEAAGANVASALTDFARAENATQLVLGASGRSRWAELMSGSVINEVIRASRGIDVHVISVSAGEDPGEPGHPARVTPRRRRLPNVSRRRRQIGWWLVALGIPLLTVALTAARDTVSLTSDLLLYLLLVVVAAAVGGVGPAVAAAVGGFLCANWFLTPPYHQLTIAESENALALVIFLIVGGLVGFLVLQASAHAAATTRSQAEVEVLQAASARERQATEAAAAEALLRARADDLRVALLRAVSHDLRTPLASIKASVTSLLQRDVDWTEEATQEFLRTIDEESDRLDDLVGNLLDLSRLQSGALQFQNRPVGYEEVVPAALASLSGPTDGVEIHLDETLPRVQADPALLERVVANLAANAVAASHPSGAVRIEAGAIGDRVDLRIVDRGRGIPLEDRERIFEPFQRRGDGGGGVGLGLAVAKGFVDAMGGELTLEDTPGGGITMVVGLPRAIEA